MSALQLIGRHCAHPLTWQANSRNTPRGISTRRRSTPETLYTAGNPTQTRQRLFGDIAPVYDELNERLSFGQHKVWKRMAVKWAGAGPGCRCLDVCCGSGDLAFLMADAAGKSGQVVALDFAPEMLDYAKRREERERGPRSVRGATVEWVEGDATSLPFQDSSFDCATMGYGLRNVASIPWALEELRRVLRPGGRAAILDFNNAAASNPVADRVQAWALQNVVVPAARSYGLQDEYLYLRPSIEAFPTGKEQEVLAKQAGFRNAVHYEIAFGLMGVLVLSA